MDRELNTTDIFLHVGLHKTATTFLQHSVFPYLEGVTYYHRSPRLAKLYIKQNKILISNEGMSGCPYLINGINYFEQFKISINQLLNIFKYPKIIICFREPSSFIESCYKQYLHEGGTLEWNEFFSIEDDSKLNPDDFFFGKYVSFLFEKVKNEDLFIYDFETFKNNPHLVVNEISKFVTGKNFTEKVNKSKKSNSAVPLTLERPLIKLNRLFGNKLRLNIFGKVISQRTVFQTLIPRYFNFVKKRDLAEIKGYFENDYMKTKKMISEINPDLYHSIHEQKSVVTHNNY